MPQLRGAFSAATGSAASVSSEARPANAIAGWFTRSGVGVAVLPSERHTPR
jgi:hypothetical protein